MTGVEHYKEAERCLAWVDRANTVEAMQYAEAQVHATLALAAATARPAVVEDAIDSDRQWVDAI